MPMLRFFFCLCLPLFSTLSAAATNQVQVDLIAFTHAYTEKDQLEQPISILDNLLTTAIPLQSHESGQYSAYQLISTSHSRLQSLWGRLSHSGQYHPLVHYTWLQPSNNQRAVQLPVSTAQGWSVQGAVRVRQGHYYLLDATISFKPLYGNAAGFVVSQKMRLKPGFTYYLDHPQGGLLIQVHKV